MTMKATLMGTGTSTGVPSIGCDCPTCTSGDPRDNRLRAGLLLRDSAPPEGAMPRTILVDCGPDFRQQALKYEIKRLDGLLLTHSHFDHIAGIDDLRIYNFRQHQTLPVYALANTLEDLSRRYDYIFHPPQKGGGVASLDLIPIHGAFDFLGLHIVPLPAKHGILDIVGFRFGEFVYMTDASYLPPATMDLMRNCKTLVLNMLREKPHSTHFSFDEAVAVAKEIGAEQTWFIHMAHQLKHAETDAALPKGMNLAWDGVEFDFDPEVI